MKRFTLLMAFAGLIALYSGCNQEQTAKPEAKPKSADGAKYLLTAEPQDAAGVIDVREAAKDEEDVVVVGRIGGSQNPWVEGRAAFSIVDLSLKACSDVEGDQCKMPWDYCCQTDLLPKATVLVKVVDDSGKLVEADARELLSVKELQTVVVSGTARRDDSGNLTLLASKLYVRP